MRINGPLRIRPASGSGPGSGIRVGSADGIYDMKVFESYPFKKGDEIEERERFIGTLFLFRNGEAKFVRWED
jgi:hypothetical protein